MPSRRPALVGNSEPSPLLRIAARPQPPEIVCEEALDSGRFVPDPELWAWTLSTFIATGSPLLNPEHDHLRFADVGMLWANEPNARQTRTILGQAEMPALSGTGGRWARAKRDQQLREWFGLVPDFLITLYGPYAFQADDASFCALVEHELMHCAQALDQFGSPKFSKATGRPIFGLRGHDVEEFTSIVTRYGPAATHTEAFARAANQTPSIAPARLASVCGTRVARAA